jgi:alkylated DNA repair dioxygenase AlkB
MKGSTIKYKSGFDDNDIVKIIPKKSTKIFKPACEGTGKNNKIVNKKKSLTMKKLTKIAKSSKLAKSTKSTRTLKHNPPKIKKKSISEDQTKTSKKKYKRVKIGIDDFNENNEFNLDNVSTIKYYRNFVPKKLHDELFKELSDDVPWTHGVYKMFGKPVKTPRLLYAMCDEDFDIKKVYNVTDPIPWTPNMLKIKKSIEKTTGIKYSYAQLNYYRNGDDYIGYHTDSEVQNGDIIASISLGAKRKFTFRSINYKNNDSNIYEIDLEKGSLIIMNDNAAKHLWKHMLPKMKNLNEVRINITFRPN